MKSKKKDNLHAINDTTASSALLQISKLFNNDPLTAPNVSSTKLYPIFVTQNVTKKPNTTKNTKGGIEYRKKNSSSKQIIKPMPDEEFDRLLKNLKKPLKTSEGGNKLRKSHNNTPMESLHNKCLCANTPINKSIKNQSHKIDENKLLLNHMFDGLTGGKIHY